MKECFRRDVIPEMTHPLSKHWEQPDVKNILISESSAIVTKQDLEALSEYSCSDPTGVYEGKTWKRRDRESGGWLLCWFSYSSETHCKTNIRKIT